MDVQAGGEPPLSPRIKAHSGPAAAHGEPRHPRLSTALNTVLVVTLWCVLER